jgi:CheY-like chemotaxis protein
LLSRTTAWTIACSSGSYSHRCPIRFVGEAADGEEALALVRRERPDVVIADLLMPRLDGLALTRRIKHERPETKVILMTSYAEAFERVAHVSDADAVVNKLGLHSGLVPAVRDVIVQCQPLDHLIELS